MITEFNFAQFLQGENCPANIQLLMETCSTVDLLKFYILFNLGLLGFFKYFNFFIDSWIDLLGAFGYEQKSEINDARHGVSDEAK